jgi:cell division protein FtsI (penicillin-binding protein 3)
MKCQRKTVLFVLIICLVLIVGRLFHLHIANRSFLKSQGDSRAVRKVKIAPSRGMITDRNGVPLAVTTPVISVWVDPKNLNVKSSNWSQALLLLNLNQNKIDARLSKKKSSRFMYLRRKISPILAAKITDLHIKGLHFD